MRQWGRQASKQASKIMFVKKITDPNIQQILTNYFKILFLKAVKSSI